jgi:hypothetical protein
MEINVDLKPAFKTTSIFLSIISIGVYFIGVWLQVVSKYPRVVDEEGITLRNGSRLSWSKLTKVVSRPAGVLWLQFGNERAIIAPSAIDHADEVTAMVREKAAHLL